MNRSLPSYLLIAIECFFRTRVFLFAVYLYLLFPYLLFFLFNINLYFLLVRLSNCGRICKMTIWTSVAFKINSKWLKWQTAQIQKIKDRISFWEFSTKFRIITNNMSFLAKSKQKTGAEVGRPSSFPVQRPTNSSYLGIISFL